MNTKKIKKLKLVKPQLKKKSNIVVIRPNLVKTKRLDILSRFKFSSKREANQFYEQYKTDANKSKRNIKAPTKSYVRKWRSERRQNILINNQKSGEKMINKFFSNFKVNQDVIVIAKRHLNVELAGKKGFFTTRQLQNLSKKLKQLENLEYAKKYFANIVTKEYDNEQIEVKDFESYEAVLNGIFRTDAENYRTNRKLIQRYNAAKKANPDSEQTRLLGAELSIKSRALRERIAEKKADTMARVVSEGYKRYQELNGVNGSYGFTGPKAKGKSKK